MQVSKVIEDVRPEPGLCRRSTAALVNEIPIRQAHPVCYQARCLSKLPFVVAGQAQNTRNAVSGRNKSKRLFLALGKLRQRLANATGGSFDESRMVVEDAQLMHFGRPHSHFGLSRGDILPVLAAAGVRTVRRGNER